MPERSPFGKLARGFAVASTLGIGFAAAVAVGVWLGYRLDLALGWRPIGFTLAFGLIGGAAGVVFVVRTVSALDRADRGKDRGPGSGERAGEG
jgi:F0F1-type ATP synthase assembly protein I